MKVFAISDLHLSINNPKPMDIFGGAWDNYVQEITEDINARVTNDDIILIAGDLSWAMTMDGAKPDLDFICALNGKKVLIRGNHDYWWKSISNIRNVLTNQTYALQNDSVKIGEYIICGTRGWTTPLNGNHASPDDKKIYDRELLRMEMALTDANKKKQSNEKIIAMIHYPPFSQTMSSSDLTNLFEKHNVSAVVYGHLHGKDSKAVKHININGIDYYLTSCDILKNKLVEIF